MKLSIIIPAYNLESYIVRCLDSLMDQDLKIDEYEVLVINDGSTDNTKQILATYSNKYSNIFIFNKKNSGVSAARNTGIEQAKGEYLLFVDGDDWMVENILNKIYNDLKENDLEIARFGYNLISKENVLIEKRILPKAKAPISGMQYVIENKTNEFYPWLYAISNKFIKQYKLNFNPLLSFCEDKEFMLRALYFSNRFQNFDYAHYNYVSVRTGSATTIFSDKHLRDSLNSNLLLYEFAAKEQKNTKFREHLKQMSAKTIEKSYYKLTSSSLWDKFWVWQEYLKNNPIFNTVICKNSFKLSLLKKSASTFYLMFYLPRALFHFFKF